MYRYMLTNTLLLIATAVLVGCGDEVESSLGADTREWLIPVNEVIDGGPGRDGIPSIE